ncbi:pentapeptide repeat-containing protein [Nocardiopsis algeriensis]|uniref:pentapeptide repeat-containing protein n=1 Tax=Nocardiopsis algeriensis TaxID=1478215 RepID=UPI003B42EABD
MTTTSTPARPVAPWRKRLKEHAFWLWERLAQSRRGLSWGAVIVGGLTAAVSLWPLAFIVRDLLGLTSGQAWRAAVAGTGAVLLAAGVVGVNWRPASERASPVRLFWLVLAAWTVAVGAVAAMVGLAWLVLDTPQWRPPQELTPKHLDAIATRAFAVVAGLGGVALLVISYRRQRTTEADAERAERASKREATRLFTERFTAASEQLGSEQAAVRLAGVHALAHLADDAPQEREDLVQMVIDVLCAYLRMPYTPEPEALPKNASKVRREEHRERQLEFASFREVRHTIIRVIAGRLNNLSWPTRWHRKDYDFTGAVFDGGDLRNARFDGGSVDFSRAVFRQGVVRFDHADFSGAWAQFNDAVFTGGQLLFQGTAFTGSSVDFHDVVLPEGAISFHGSVFLSGYVDFSKASGACPDELLEYANRFNPAVVQLPEAWRPPHGSGSPGAASGRCR